MPCTLLLPTQHPSSQTQQTLPTSSCCCCSLQTYRCSTPTPPALSSTQTTTEQRPLLHGPPELRPPIPSNTRCVASVPNAPVLQTQSGQEPKEHSFEPELNQRPKDGRVKGAYSPPLYQLSYRRNHRDLPCTTPFTLPSPLCLRP